MLIGVFLVIIATVLAEETVTYDNHSLFKIVPNNEEHLKVLKDLYNEAKGYDFWRIPSKVNEFVSVVAPPELRKDLEGYLEKHGLSGEAVLEDLQEAFNQQKVLRKRRSADDELFWTNFQLLDDINNWFYSLQRQHPNVVTVITTGTTYEGRNVTGIRISRRSGRKAFVLEGGLQGADWLSPVTLTYVVDQLINSNDDEARTASMDFDWYIFPVTNPDGYEYSQNRIRTWVRNRRATTGGNFGIDLTRNWNSHWGVSGGSFNPADNNFIGPGPFSESETRTFSRFVDSISDNLIGYISFRAFGQRLLLPFAHTTEHKENYDQMIIIGRRAMGSLSVRYGTMYRVGTSGEVHDGATGNAADWVKARYNTSMVATYLLRDEGQSGFAINPNVVLPNCEEVFDSILAIIREARFINLI